MAKYHDRHDEEIYQLGTLGSYAQQLVSGFFMIVVVVAQAVSKGSDTSWLDAWTVDRQDHTCLSTEYGSLWLTGHDVIGENRKTSL
jgi:hypothetical protein